MSNTPPGYEEIGKCYECGAPCQYEICQQCAGSQVEPLWPAPVDVAALAATDPEPPVMIINDWMPCGYATLLAGHGGIGKSAIALHLSVCIATGRPFFGLPTDRRRVLYLSCEDRTGVLHWRLSRICSYMEMDMAHLAGHLDILDLVGNNAILYENKAFKDTTITPPFAELRRVITELNAELIVVDGVADTFGGNENSRSEVKQFVNRMVSLVPAETGAVLLVAHVNKLTAQGTTSEGYSGSTGWHNSVRARWYLYPETEITDDGTQHTGRMRLELQKSNLGPAGDAMTFEWDKAAHLFVGKTEQGMSHFDRNLRDEEERSGILAAIAEVTEGGDYVPAATTGQRTARHVLAATKSLPESMKQKANRKRFWRHVEKLRRMGELHEGSITRKDRHSVVTLELKAASHKAAGNAGNE